MPSWYRRDSDSIILDLHVQPGARRNEIAGLHGKSLKIRLAAPPVEGRANDALLRFLAGLFKVPLRQISLQTGVKSRQKTVLIQHSCVAPDSIMPEITDPEPD